MEAAIHRNDGLAAAAHLLGIQASKLDGAFVGFCARVGEEYRPRSAEELRHANVQHVGEELCNLAALLDVIVVANVNELGSLILDGAHNGRMAVAQAVYADASNKVEVGFAFVVFNFHARAFDQQYRLTSEGMHDEMVVELLCFFKTHGVPFFADGDRRKHFRASKPIRSFYEFGGLANTPRTVFSTSSHSDEMPRCPAGASLPWRIPPCRRRSGCLRRLR